jgi:nickel-dependent lactate racemase
VLEKKSGKYKEGGTKDLLLKYGKGSLCLNMEELVQANIITANERPGVKSPIQLVRERLKAPLGTLPLSHIVRNKKPEKVVIVVNDLTRPTPNDILLPPILETLHREGVKEDQVTFLVATGIHEPHTVEQNKQIFGENLVERYRFISHDCDSENVKNLGATSYGTPIFINSEVFEADLLISVGVILPHYFAGFSGGRKSILPGVASRETIELNHSRMVELLDSMPPLETNPLSIEMVEGARLAGLDFIVNVVPNSQKEIVEVVAGDFEKAWLEGVKISAEMYEIPLPEEVDVTFVSCGGFPRDINMYQAQKALDHADHITKKGGTIVLLAECPMGFGEETFENFLRMSRTPMEVIEKIRQKFVLGGHKAFGIARVALNKEILLISNFDQQQTAMLFAQKVNDLDEALSFVKNKHGFSFSSVVMPVGSLTVPMIGVL